MVADARRRTVGPGKIMWPRLPRQAGTSASDGPSSWGMSIVSGPEYVSPHQPQTLVAAFCNSCSSQFCDCASTATELNLMVTSQAPSAADDALRHASRTTMAHTERVMT